MPYIIFLLLQSKVIFPGFARGTFNAGLLSTEAGTVGRFTGNAALAVVGAATGVGTVVQLVRLGHLLYGMMAVGAAGVLLWLALVYHRLAG